MVGCGGTQNPRDQDMTAAEHEGEAEQEERAGDERESHYDEAAVGTGAASHQAFHGTDVYNPTAHHAVAAEAHREHAQEHRARAGALRAFEDAECSQFPAETRASCPLLLGLQSVEDIDGGSQLTFDPETDFGSVIDHLRCHVAFASAQGREGINHCALYVHGAEIHVEEHIVTLTTPEADHVAELRDRVALQAP